MTDYISNIDIGAEVNGEWTQTVQNADLGSNNWYSLAYNGTKFVALGASGYISTSTDGTTWTTAVQNTNLSNAIGTGEWGLIGYGNNKFVAIGRQSDSVYISTSTDGETWTTATKNSNLKGKNWLAIAYDGTKFVALGFEFTEARGYISTSTDGTTWTTAVQTSNIGSGFNTYYSLVYDGTKFIALSTLGYISISTDGITWVQTQNSNLGNKNWHTIAYDGTKFVALSNTGYISTSIDGTTWTVATRNANFVKEWTSLAYGSTKFVALSFTGYISTSTKTSKIPIGGTNFDGQWIQSFITIIDSSGTKTGEEVDLSSYLPNDNYNYEVKFKIYGYDNDSTYSYYLNTDVFDNGQTTTGVETVYSHIYGGTYSRQNANIFDLPVGTGRYVRLYGSGADEIKVYALGYRRIGTNE